jgi:DNA-binding SARP family transcriptional activator
VHLREFGEPALVVEGTAVRPKIRKSLELLSFLLSRPQATASRQDVLTALWNGRDDDPTRAYLRQAVRHLRDVLPEQVTLASAGDSLSVQGGVASEVAELDTLLLEAAREQGARRRQLLLDALSLGQRGIFLEGSGNVVWVDERRLRIESLLVDARLDTAELLLEESRFQEALALADEVLEHDRMLERGWRVRMKALGMLGDADGVADAYRRCRAALAEVDLEPSPATLELARQLRH